MRHMGRAMLRWAYTLLLYALFAAPLFWLMGTGLSRAGISPPGYTAATWTRHMRGLFLYTLAGSLALVALWNLLYSWRLLGGRDPRVSVNVLNFLFLLLHLVLSFALFFFFTDGPGARDFLLGSPLPFLALNLLPSLLIVPFFFATRLLGPESAAYRFQTLNKLRPTLGLRYY